MARAHAPCFLFLAAVLAAHAQAEGNLLEVMDDSQSEHLAEDIDAVMPFLDAEELIQMRGMVQKANTALQGKLASDAQALHLAKLEVEKAASSAQLKFKKADATSQAATQQALASKSQKDANEAVKQKKLAADAKAKHTKLQKDQAEARIKADAALKKAQDAGATVSLPTTASSTVTSAAPSSAATANVGSSATATPPPPPPPAKPLKDPPAPKNPKQPTKLETILKDRRNKRIQREAHVLRKKFEEAKVEKQSGDYVLSKAMAKYQKLKTKEAEAHSAKSAARKEEQLDEAKIIKAHVALNIAKADYKSVDHAAKLAKAMVRENKVEERVASSLAKTGGARRNLKKADKAREAGNERLKQAKADTVSYKLAVVKAEAAVTASKAALVAKQDTLKGLHHRLKAADSKYAGAVYDIKMMKGDIMKAAEDKAQAKAEDDLDTKKYKTMHELATAAALKANQAKNGDEASLKALLRDPKEAKKEALAKVKDQNGISDLGTALIAPKGAIAKEYISKFKKMPLKSSGRNPILEAEAKASLADTSAAAALKIATTPGPAAVAAAKITVSD